MKRPPNQLQGDGKSESKGLRCSSEPPEFRSRARAPPRRGCRIVRKFGARAGSRGGGAGERLPVRIRRDQPMRDQWENGVIVSRRLKVHKSVSRCESART
eukprot:1511753-Pleurochrysis_carterae.AAC.1